MNYLIFFWAIKIGVALEHIELARVFERKMNIFHLRKIFQRLFWGGLDRGMMIREGNEALG